MAKEKVSGDKAGNEGIGRKLPEPKILIAASVLTILAVALVWGAVAKPCCRVPGASGALLGANGNGTAGNATSTAPAGTAPGADKVELYHFHGTHQCYSCVRVGELAEKTVNTYFADELASGKLVFGHINYDLPENEGLSEKFGVTGSSIWIGTTSSGGFSKEEDTKVWYKLQDEAGFMSYLKGILEKRLAGDLS